MVSNVVRSRYSRRYTVDTGRLIETFDSKEVGRGGKGGRKKSDREEGKRARRRGSALDVATRTKKGK